LKIKSIKVNWKRLYKYVEESITEEGVFHFKTWAQDQEPPINLEKERVGSKGRQCNH